MCTTWCRRRSPGGAPRRSSGSPTSWARSAARTSARCSRRCSTRAAGPRPATRGHGNGERPEAAHGESGSGGRARAGSEAGVRGGSGGRPGRSPSQPSPSRDARRARGRARARADEPGDGGPVAARASWRRGRQLRGRRDRRARPRSSACRSGTTAARRRAPSAQPPNEGMKHFVPQLGGPFEAPFPSDPEPLSCFSIAYATGKTTLYKKPGGAVRIRLSSRTEWGSPRIFGVIRRRGDWISVQAPELDNGEVAWMETNRARIDCVHWAMRANLKKPASLRRAQRQDRPPLRDRGRAAGKQRRPSGRFSVTDKLRVTDPGSPYGCCVLALSGHQTHLPAELARRRPPRRARDEGAVEPRPGGEPRLHARDLDAGALADQDDPAGHAAVRQGLISRTAAAARSVSVNLPPFQALLEEHRSGRVPLPGRDGGAVGGRRRVPGDLDRGAARVPAAAAGGQPARVAVPDRAEQVDRRPPRARPAGCAGGGRAGARVAPRAGAPRTRSLWARLRELPAKQRTAVFCRVVLGMPYDELAALLESSEDAARRNVHEGLKRLREELDR